MIFHKAHTVLRGWTHTPNLVATHPVSSGLTVDKEIGIIGLEYQEQTEG